MPSASARSPHTGDAAGVLSVAFVGPSGSNVQAGGERRDRKFAKALPSGEQVCDGVFGCSPWGLAKYNKCIYDNCRMSHDPGKRRTNLHKHRIDLPGCMDVFDSPMLTREDDREDYGEQRWVSLGWAHGTVVVLVWTDREEGPRLISCREAAPHEREAYYRAYPKC